jgi:hypothetical protein
VGKYLRSRITATNVVGTVNQYSDATIAVGLKPAATTTLSIRGNAISGQTLTMAQPIWVGTPAPTYSYRWYRCDTAINTQTIQQPKNCVLATEGSSSYELTNRDFGKYISSGVIATNAHGEVLVFSKSTNKIESAPIEVFGQGVRIAGSALVGQTLSAVRGSWVGTSPIALTYQWMLCTDARSTDSCTNISGATRSTYRILDSQKGQVIRVKEFAKNKVNPTNPAVSTSSSSGFVGALPAFTGKLTYSGASTFGSTLTLTSTLVWSGYPIPEVTTQWLRCKLRVSIQTSTMPRDCVAIEFANADVYAVTASDLNHFITVMRVGTSTAGTTRVLAPSTRTAIKNS